MRRTSLVGAMRAMTSLFVVSVAACGGSGGGSSAGEGGAVASAPSTAERGYTDVTVERLHDMMAAKNFTLVNVHTPFVGDIPGTDLSIPYDQIRSRAAELPTDRSARIVLYCRSGHMSVEASQALVALGYTNVYNLTGGLKAWQAAGY